MGAKLKVILVVLMLVALLSGGSYLASECCCDSWCCCTAIEGYYLRSYSCACSGEDCFNECNYMPKN